MDEEFVLSIHDLPFTIHFIYSTADASRAISATDGGLC
jgi:hypothetical protein